MMLNSWDEHYKKNRSNLCYPDENLVRLLQKNFSDSKDKSYLNVLDLGCGSGRHLQLLTNLGFKNITGFDSSYNALNICRENYNSSLVHGDNRFLPFKNNSIDLIIAWGSLHYSYKKDLIKMIGEIYRILKRDGLILSTLRSSNDTYLKKGKQLEGDTWETDLNDLNGSIVSFYNDDELKEYYKNFSKLKYGIIERSIIGDLDKIISHWVIYSKK